MVDAAIDGTGNEAARAAGSTPGGRLYGIYLNVALVLLVVPFALSYLVFVATGDWAIRTAYQDVAPLAHAVHAGVGVGLLLLFPLQAILGRLIGSGRPGVAAWHRLEGRVLVPGYLLYAATGMVILWDSSVLARGVASLAGVLQVSVLVIASMVALAAAWRAARAGRIARHMDHVLFALVALTSLSVGRLVIAVFKAAGLEPGAVSLPGGATGFVSDTELGGMATTAILIAIWLSYALQRGIARSQWGKTAAMACLPLFWPVALLPGLGQ